MPKTFLAAMTVLLLNFAFSQNTPSAVQPRVADLGLKVGILPAGPLDAITDVAGVEVGHRTIIHGDDIRTGVTAIVPHSGNMFREKVPGAVFVGNAFGKLAGSTQVNELGQIETPILLTATEEAVYNSLFRATTITGRGHTVEALPIEKTTEILKKYGAIK